MKLMRKAAGAREISCERGPRGSPRLIETNNLLDVAQFGVFTIDHEKSPYIEYLLSCIDATVLRLLKVVINAGKGFAVLVIDLLDESPPIEYIMVNYQPNEPFPIGISNPLSPENRTATADAVFAHGADVSFVRGGDFASCFFFNANGQAIECHYIVGLLAAQSKIGHMFVREACPAEKPCMAKI